MIVTMSNRNRLTLLYTGEGLSVRVPWWVVTRMAIRWRVGGEFNGQQMVAQVADLLEAAEQSGGHDWDGDDGHSLVQFIDLDVISVFTLLRGMDTLACEINGTETVLEPFDPRYANRKWLPTEPGSHTVNRERLYYCLKAIALTAREHLSRVQVDARDVFRNPGRDRRSGAACVSGGEGVTYALLAELATEGFHVRFRDFGGVELSYTRRDGGWTPRGAYWAAWPAENDLCAWLEAALREVRLRKRFEQAPNHSTHDNRWWPWLARHWEEG